ncbi:MAG: MarR family transcriptional regulator [Candidatus Competibacteraceae bacterium]|nr:MarR family transcriptional regulator [Candidatus Competibacteraceae bacterium]
MPREQTVDFQIKHVWHSINRMYNQRGIEYDLTTSIGFVLLNIDSKNGTPATKIAPLLGMEPRSLSRMLKVLEEKELIYRKSDLKDKRLVKIFLTETGKEKKEIAKRTVKQFNQVVQREISTERLGVFFDVIADLQRIIEKNQVFNS